MANYDLSGVNPVGTPSSLDVFNTANQAISFKEQLPDLVQKLREALTSKFNESPLFGQRESAMQSFLNAPSQARADISQMQRTSGVPLAPTQQEAITSARRSAAYAPLSTSSLMLSSAYGGLEDIIGGGMKAFEAAAGAQTERANLLNTLRQQEIERQFKEREFALKTTKAAGGVGGTTTKSKEAKLTMDYMADVQSYETREEALRDFELMKGLMAAQGVDIDAVRNAIDTYFPPPAPEPEPVNTGGSWFNWLKNLSLKNLLGLTPAGYLTKPQE